MISAVQQGAGSVIITADSHAEGFDREPFTFRHDLDQEPLLSLAQLSRAVAEDEGGPWISYHAVGARYTEGWQSLYQAKPRFASAAQAITALGESDAWIKVRLNGNPRFTALTGRIVDELSGMCGLNLQKISSRLNLSVFISSPGAVTPYHFDHETNFLFQVMGEKTLRLFDPQKPHVVDARDLEDFYVGSSTPFRQGADEHGSCYELAAGQGVHNPSRWPHWAQTGDSGSVTLSVNFSLKRRDVEARVFQCNYYLRRFGFSPRPMGASSLSDALKKMFLAEPFRRVSSDDDDYLQRRLGRIRGPINLARHVAGFFRGASKTG